MKRNKENGNSIITAPIIITIGIVLISVLIVTSIKILVPYIWYEKLSSACLKYVFVIEEYGYLTKKEALNLLDELEKQGFEKEKISLEYTEKAVEYGNEIYLKIGYDYEFELPITGKQSVPMQIEKHSICKR